MSLIANHFLIGQRAAPTLIRTQFLTFNKSTPLTMTLSVTPVEGSLMITMFGSNQSRDFSLSGWTNISSVFSGANIHCWYKFAGSSESTTINVPWTTGGLAQGCMNYFELGGANRVTPLSYAAGAVTQTGGTTHDYGAHDIQAGVFAIELNHNGDNTVTSSVNDGYTAINSGSAQRTRFAYKIYNASESGVNMTWTYSGSDDSNICIIGFNGI